MSIIPDVSSTQVTITDVANSTIHKLSFHTADDNKLENYYWEYNGNDLEIECGKSYRLDVSAVIDGKKLTASSITTVPVHGFNIVEQNYDSLVYRKRNEHDEIINFELSLERSAGTTLYLAIINALSKDSDLFIYDNPYEDLDKQDVEEDLDDYSYELEWIQNTPETPGQSKLRIWWTNLWFYDTYQIVVYAVDNNYKQFLQTYDDVQEQDGNFHEPYFHFEGDGIGVFGSVIADTTYIKVLKE